MDDDDKCRREGIRQNCSCQESDRLLFSKVLLSPPMLYAVPANIDDTYINKTL